MIRRRKRIPKHKKLARVGQLAAVLFILIATILTALYLSMDRSGFISYDPWHPSQEITASDGLDPGSEQNPLLIKHNLLIFMVILKLKKG